MVVVDVRMQRDLELEQRDGERTDEGNASRQASRCGSRSVHSPLSAASGASTPFFFCRFRSAFAARPVILALRQREYKSLRGLNPLTDCYTPSMTEIPRGAGYTPIDCNLYDYVEIACMYRYPVRVATSGGQILTGVAVDTVIDADKAEHLELDVDGKPVLVRLDTLSVLEPLLDNARFGKVHFKE